MQNSNGDIWKGAVAGVAGGLAASYAMTKFLALSEKASEIREAREHDAPHNPQHSTDRGEAESARRKHEEDEDATVKAASRISEGLFHHKLTKKQKKVAGPAVHYAFGGLTGGIYGALAELAPRVTRGAGLPFGTVVWLGADEIGIPALKLADPPLEHPPAVHARAFAAHVVYGLTTEAVRLLVRRAL
jgi:hypothetical protein